MRASLSVRNAEHSRLPSLHTRGVPPASIQYAAQSIRCEGVHGASLCVSMSPHHHRDRHPAYHYVAHEFSSRIGCVILGAEAVLGGSSWHQGSTSEPAWGYVELTSEGVGRVLLDQPCREHQAWEERSSVTGVGFYPHGRAPIGYEKEAVGSHTRLVPDEEAASVIVRMCEAMAAGRTGSQIATQLNTEGFRTSGGSGSTTSPATPSTAATSCWTPTACPSGHWASDSRGR